MRLTITRPKLLILAGALCTSAWTPTILACSVEPVISSICIMSFSPARYASFNNTYILAAGQTMQIGAYSALFALIGTTYGGNGSTNFMLPDLRGRVVAGYSPANSAFAPGATGGNAAVNLTVAQLPSIALPLNNVAVTLNNVQATTTLSGLSATANLAGVVLRGASSGLKVNASSSANGSASPSNNYLGKSGGAAGNIYTASAPDVTLNSGAISGELALTVGAGVTAPVSISGTAATTVTGGGVANGMTGNIGSNMPVSTMPPYIALPYYIALTGLFPSGD